MDNIVIRIRDRRAVLLTQSYIVNGNTDYVIEFDFDSEWDEFAEKTARFVYCDKQDARHWIDVPITDNTCNAPKLERVDRVEVGVYAGSIRTTTAALIPCIWSITDLQGEIYTPKRDFFNEALALLDIYKTRGSDAYEAAALAFQEYWDTVFKK